MTRMVATGVILTCALSLTGCQAVAEGPATIGGSDGALCTTTGDDTRVLVGEVVGAPTGGDITVTAVELVDAKGLTLSGSWLLPITPGVAIVGTAAADDRASLHNWSKHVEATGGVVAAGDTASLVLELTIESAGAGTADSVAITYEYGVGTFRKETSTRIKVAAGDSCSEDVWQ